MAGIALVQKTVGGSAVKHMIQRTSARVAKTKTIMVQNHNIQNTSVKDLHENISNFLNNLILKHWESTACWHTEESRNNQTVTYANAPIKKEMCLHAKTDDSFQL